MDTKRPTSLVAAITVAALGTATALHLSGGGNSANGDREPAWSAPPRSASWQYQLDGHVTPRRTPRVWDLDGADTPRRVVRRLHALGAYAICYFSAGTFERWRRDRGRFRHATLGKPNGWPGERWLDIRRVAALAPVMRARLDSCRAKGFDAVEADNVDGWANDTGFAIRAGDQLGYNRWLTRAAHARGLAIGLKNDLEQGPVLASEFDFAVVEECVERGECALTRPFTRRGKAVFDVEYRGARSRACAAGAAAAVSVLVHTQALDRPGVPCSPPSGARG